MKKNVGRKHPNIHHNHNVSYKLLERRRISDALNELIGKNLNEKELHKVITKMAGFGSEVLPVCVSRLRTEKEDMLTVISLIIEMLGDEDLVPSLLEMLKQPDLPDENKTTILSLLCFFGCDPTELPLDKMFNDFDGIANDSLDRLLNDIHNDESMLPLVLEEFSLYPAEFQSLLVNELASRHDNRAVPLLLLFARSWEPEVVTTAIRALGMMATEGSLRGLITLANSSSPGLQALARRELIRMNMQGININTYRKIPLKKFELYKVMVSSIDGQGNRGVWLAWRIPGRKTLLKSCNLLINCHSGIKECWGSPRLRVKEFDKVINEVMSDFWILEDNLDYAKNVISDALYRNQISGESVPLEFAYWQQLIDVDIVPHQLQIVLPNLPVVDNEMIKLVGNLNQLTPFSDWIINDINLFQYAEEYISIRTRTKTERIYSNRLKMLLKKYITASFQDKIHQIRHRLTLNADFCYQFSESERELSQLINVAINLFDSMSVWEHPFIQNMFTASLDMAIDNWHQEYFDTEE